MPTPVNYFINYQKYEVDGSVQITGSHNPSEYNGFKFTLQKESFFGDLHGQGRHAIEFFTQTKVVVERWPKDWTRKF